MPDQNKVAFLQGLLVGIVANNQLTDYEEVRRLIGCSKEQVGEYLDAARQGLAEGSDFCSIVVNSTGLPGLNWRKNGFSPQEWAKARTDAHRYWDDRRRLDKDEFEAKYGSVPPVPAKNPT
jgi:hypothetical protein